MWFVSIVIWPVFMRFTFFTSLCIDHLSDDPYFIHKFKQFSSATFTIVVGGIIDDGIQIISNLFN